MPKKTSITGCELFIVDNSDDDWKVLRYLHDWCQISKGIDIATGYFEIGSLLALKDQWQKVDIITWSLFSDGSSLTPALRSLPGFSSIKAEAGVWLVHNPVTLGHMFEGVRLMSSFDLYQTVTEPAETVLPCGKLAFQRVRA